MMDLRRLIRLTGTVIGLIIVATAVAWALNYTIPLLVSYIASLEDPFILVIVTTLAVGAMIFLAIGIFKFVGGVGASIKEDIKAQRRKSILVCWLSFPKRDILMPRHARKSVAEKLVDVFREEMPEMALLAIPSQENPKGGKSDWGVKLGRIGVRRFLKQLLIVVFVVRASISPEKREHEGQEVRPCTKSMRG